MRKLLLTAIGMSIVGLGSCPTFANGVLGPCSLATLRGTYAWAYTSSNATDTYRFSSSGMESYDGEGHLTWYQLWSDSSGNYTYSGNGTYSFTTLTDVSSGTAVTASCVAKVTYATGSNPWTYFVVPDGGAYFYNSNTSSSLGGGEVKRVSLLQLVR